LKREEKRKEISTRNLVTDPPFRKKEKRKGGKKKEGEGRAPTEASTRASCC